MRRWNDRMLKTKMFIAFSIVSLFIVGVTCVTFYCKNTGDVTNQTFALSKIISKQLSEMINLYTQNIQELSLAISIDPSIQNHLFEFYKASNPIHKETIGYKLNPVLFNFSYPKSYVESISIYTLDEHLYQYTKLVKPRPMMPFSSRHLSEFGRVLSNKPFMLIPADEGVGSRDKPGKVVSFIRKINKIPTQTTIGFVAIDINVNAFRIMLANPNANELEHTMHVVIADDTGRIIFENGTAPAGDSTGRFDAAVFQKPITHGELQWRDKRYLYAFERSHYTGWNTVILIPKDVVLLKQKRIQDIVFIVGAVSMMLVAAVSYMLSHQITLPLHKLMRKMSRVELGDFNQRMEYEGNNEIGRLSKMYNHMLDSISRLIHQVYESRLAENHAQLSALHAQINPHFLYNTLNIMKSISRLRGIEEVAEISESLAGLFQYSMKNLAHPVPLRKELEHIHNYFKIQQHRFGDRMELWCDVPEPLLDAAILKLTIQPLVENAVNHGLRKMKNGGRIHIQAFRRDHALVLEVTDNGEGMSEAERTQLQASLDNSTPLDHDHGVTNGIGVLNIHQRIQLSYGKEYGLKVASAPGRGTTVTLLFPNES
ncbi:cache domain-containing sensor histidine kinase [Paenibacillus xerothermodurans]|nr:sensor histidine kinase [Paenibacillus xerothermodurans]